MAGYSETGESNPEEPKESSVPKDEVRKERPFENLEFTDAKAKNELIKDLTKQLIDLNEWRKQAVFDLVDKDR